MQTSLTIWLIFLVAHVQARIDAIGGASFDVNGESQQYLEKQSLTVTMYLKS